MIVVMQLPQSHRSRDTVSLSTNLFGYPGFTRSTPQQQGKEQGMPVWLNTTNREEQLV